MKAKTWWLKFCGWQFQNISWCFDSKFIRHPECLTYIMSWLNHIIIRHQFGAFIVGTNDILCQFDSVCETCLTIARHLSYFIYNSKFLSANCDTCQLSDAFCERWTRGNKLRWTSQNIIIFVRKICPNVSSAKCWPFSLNLWNTWNITCHCPWDSTPWCATNCWIQVKSTATPTRDLHDLGPTCLETWTNDDRF